MCNRGGSAVVRSMDIPSVLLSEKAWIHGRNEFRGSRMYGTTRGRYATPDSKSGFNAAADMIS